MIGQAFYIHYLTWSWPQTNKVAIVGPTFKRRLMLRELKCVIQSHKAKKKKKRKNTKMCTQTWIQMTSKLKLLASSLNSFIWLHQIVNVDPEYYSKKFRTRVLRGRQRRWSGRTSLWKWHWGHNSKDANKPITPVTLQAAGTVNQAVERGHCAWDWN